MKAKLIEIASIQENVNKKKEEIKKLEKKLNELKAEKTSLQYEQTKIGGKIIDLVRSAGLLDKPLKVGGYIITFSQQFISKSFTLTVEELIELDPP